MTTAVTATTDIAPPREAAGGADAVFQILRDWGVDRVFICPGSTEAAFLDASLRHPDIPLVPTSHESITVSMADAYARMTGRPAVAYVHTHLGLTNGLAHLACAALERSPVVVLNGLKSIALQGNGGFTTTSDVRALARQFVKWEWQTLRADSLGEDLTRALRAAVSEPAGPTYLAIPQDLLEHRGPVPCPDSAGFRVRARSRPDPEDVRAAAERLAAAARPLIVAGSEVARGGAWPELLALAERLGAPVMAEHFQTLDAAPGTIGRAPGAIADEPGTMGSGARGVFDVPAYAGIFDAGLEAVREADVIFLAGTRSPTQFDASFAAILPPVTPLIHLSADAGEVAKRLPTAVPLVADPGLCLSDLNACLDEQQRRTEGDDEYRRRAVAAHREAVRRMREEAEGDFDRVPIRVPALMHALVQRLEPGTLIVDDSVTGKGSVLRHALAHDAGMRYLTTGGGSLGWAVGGALGAALAEPGTPVVGIVGDGVLQFGLPALWTAVHERIPVTYVVVNNRGYAAVKAALVRHGGQAADEEVYPASELPGPDFAAIADGFGALGRRVEHLDELECSLADARASGGPAVIDVLTDPTDLGPRVPPKGGRP